MALSLKTISVGSETGVQDIQSNFTTIKSAVDTLQDGISTIQVLTNEDYQILNGVNFAGKIHILNYQTHQLIFISGWVSNLNMGAWQTKAICSIPKSYLRFSNLSNMILSPAEYFDSNTALGGYMDGPTREVRATTRAKSVDATQFNLLEIAY